MVRGLGRRALAASSSLARTHHGQRCVVYMRMVAAGGSAEGGVLVVMSRTPWPATSLSQPSSLLRRVRTHSRRRGVPRPSVTSACSSTSTLSPGGRVVQTGLSIAAPVRHVASQTMTHSPRSSRYALAHATPPDTTAAASPPQNAAGGALASRRPAAARLASRAACTTAGAPTRRATAPIISRPPQRACPPSCRVAASGPRGVAQPNFTPPLLLASRFARLHAPPV